MSARRALVTGAASGIGRATARRLAADGYRLAVVDRDAAGLDRLVRSVPEALSEVVDLTDRPGLESAVARICSAWDGIDLLVNNAGIGFAATTVGTDPEQWDATLSVNLTAPFLACRAVLPVMIAGGGGVIVNVASVAAVVGVRNRAAYCASKAGLVGLTRAIAVDHAHQGIRANAICPGTVATEWIDKILANSTDPDADRRAMEQRQLDGRMGSPEEVASGIAFLASEDARFVNGSVFVMDGGMSAV
ncbi:MAG TPA: SDR family oxidoreductase [Acidimicrobiales bacterium]|nr:SDR family oxidoreductase [Acidimicrobiales bacterium]